MRISLSNRTDLHQAADKAAMLGESQITVSLEDFRELLDAYDDASCLQRENDALEERIEQLETELEIAESERDAAS